MWWKCECCKSVSFSFSSRTWWLYTSVTVPTTWLSGLSHDFCTEVDPPPIWQCPPCPLSIRVPVRMLLTNASDCRIIRLSEEVKNYGEAISTKANGQGANDSAVGDAGRFADETRRRVGACR